MNTTVPEKWFPLTRWILQWFTLLAAGWLETIGGAVQNTLLIVQFVLRGKIGWSHVLQQCAFVGWGALGIALVMTTMTGMIIALQLATEMSKQGAANFVGALVSMSILREMASVMTGFSVIALVGSAFASQLATMKTTSQVDALQMLQVHPVRYLVLPRVLACMAMVPLLSIITAVSGILGGALVSHLVADISYPMFFDSVMQFTEFKDISAVLLKSVTFGFLISIFSTTIGLQVEGGAREVGQSTTRAVVTSFVAMAVFDYLITFAIYGTE